MGNLIEKIQAEQEHIEKTIKLIEKATNKKKRTTLEVAGLGTLIHNFYNGLENILKQILKDHGHAIKQSSNWHKNIIETASSKKIITKKLQKLLYQYLAFRHFFVHGYGILLKEDRLLALCADISPTYQQFKKDLKI